MRVLLIYRVDTATPANHGVTQKMQGMGQALINMGHQVDHLHTREDHICLNEKKIRLGAIHWLNQYRWFDYARLLVMGNVYDLIIIRYGLASPAFVSFIEEYKSRYPTSRIIIDMPTYPYEQEWTGIKGRLALTIDRLYRSQLKGVEAILHSGKEKEIYGIPTIPMTNAIDISRFPLSTRPKDTSTIHAIAVGKWQYWHGLDRVLDGMKDHVDFVLNIVGDGPYLANLREQVQSNSLSSRVIFHGSRTGAELTEIFDQCHVAIGTLGLHRKGVSIDSSLKHREYCARGIPFILSSPDLDFGRELPFLQYHSVSDEPIDIQKIIDWYHSLDTTIGQTMRNHAERKLTWESRMKKVISHETNKPSA